MKAVDIERAIETIEDSRTTHVHWAEYRARGGADDPGAGDEAHHRRCLVEYDHVLVALRYAIRLERQLALLGPAAERGLTPDGTHSLLPGGYCPDCQGCCLRGFAEAVPLVEPSPFYRPEPGPDGRRAARRCSKCNHVLGRCSCVGDR